MTLRSIVCLSTALIAIVLIGVAIIGWSQTERGGPFPIIWLGGIILMIIVSLEYALLSRGEAHNSGPVL